MSESESSPYETSGPEGLGLGGGGGEEEGGGERGEGGLSLVVGGGGGWGDSEGFV